MQEDAKARCARSNFGAFFFPTCCQFVAAKFRQKVPIRIDFCSINMSGAVAALFALSTLAQAYVGGAVLEHLTG